MATCAHAMLDRNHCRIAFALEETLEARKQILVDFSRQLLALSHQLLEL